ncbi:sulfite exporter TauE/SafE family protein [Daeguia caeni]|uniref:Probable membrane transporter protein n=1 Tax=Daeguia caeni TaxID=439612 RepID=A0ABV9H798_9HYPH
MIVDFHFYAVAIPAVIILGLAKGGFIGLGNLAIPLMALAISPVHAAAVLLPILLVQDTISIISYRATWDRRNLSILLPGAFIGVGLGYLLASHVSDAGLGFCVGLISLIFGLRRLILERAGPVAAARPGTIFGLICGAGAGFTSMIAHAGGPPFQIYVIPQRLPRDVFVGTTVIFFACVNYVKIIPYFALGQFTREHLFLSATLIPVAILSTWAGIWLVRRIDAERFYKLIYILMIVIGTKLIWDSAGSILA